MDRGHDDGTGAAPERLSVEGFLFRAALLAGCGREARAIAGRLAGAAAHGSGRSCLEGGAPLQLTVDAPGAAELRVGLRIDDRIEARAIAGLVAPAAAEHLRRAVSRMPPVEHESLGTWLFWSRSRSSIFVDLRDADPIAALARLQAVVGPRLSRRIDTRRPPPGATRPWAVRLDADDSGIIQAHAHWLVDRHASVQALADGLHPGLWPRARAVLADLLRRPDRSGRFVIVTALDDATTPGLRIGSTGWSLVPEDADKQGALGRTVATLGGPRAHAEALWSLCRGGAEGRWRVGRACEVRVTDTGARLRVFLTPPVQVPMDAGISSSSAALSSASATVGEPSSAKRTTR